MTRCTAKQAVKVAKKWVGYLEKRSNGNLKSKTANAGTRNFTYFGYVMHNAYPATMDYPAAWCDAFFDFCIYTACGENLSDTKHVLCGYPDDYTVNSANYYKCADRFGKEPRIGAQVFFSSNGTYGGIHHTGIVVAVSDTSITTIEGNTSGGSAVIPNGGAVCRKTYSRSNPRIAGYGYPRYKATKKAAKKEAKVNAREYVVVASCLNIRDKRSTKSGRIVGCIGSGSKLKLRNVKKNAAGNTWGEIAEGKYKGFYIAVIFKGRIYMKAS